MQNIFFKRHADKYSSRYSLSTLKIVKNLHGLFSAGILLEKMSKTISVCAGDIQRASCPQKEFIAVQDVQYGTKRSSICSLSNNSSGCCDYNANDCFQHKYDETSQQQACSGRELCLDVAISTEDSSSCGRLYPRLNHYLTMIYYCIPGKASSLFPDCPHCGLSSAKFYL